MRTSLFVIVLICSFAMMGPTCRENGSPLHPILTAPLSLPQNPGAGAVAIGDLNGDGLPDFVSCGNGIMINLGVGDGRFSQELLPFATPFPEFAMVKLADMNRDDRLDLVTCTTGLHLYLFLGNGDGTFRAATMYQTNQLAQTFLLADFDEDGQQDVLLPYDYQPRASFFHGNGDGTLTFEREVETGRVTQFAVTTDVDRDDHLDVVLSNRGHGFVVLEGDGEGNFTPHNGPATPMESYSLAVADITGDDVPDIVVGCGHGVKTFVGNGTTTFYEWSTFLQGSGETTAMVADFNSDGRNDLAAVEFNTGLLHLFYAMPGGGFDEGRAFPAIGSGYCWGMQAADFDTNGRLDFVLIPGNQTSIIFARDDGTYTTVRKFPGVSLNRFDLVDVTGDTTNDILGINPYSPLVCIPGNGDGTFGEPRLTPIDSEPRDFATGDFDGDGRLDVVLIAYELLDIYLGDGTGGFVLSQRFSDQYFLRFEHVVVADFNNDDRSDIIAAGASVHAQTIQKLYIFLNTGDDTFGMSNMTTSFEVSDFLASDINRDGEVDLALLNYQKQALAIFLGNGDGSFRYTDSYPLLPWPSRIIQGDLDRNGFTDLLIQCGTNLIVMLGEASGHFTPLYDPQPNSPVGRLDNGGNLADLDGDGFLDLVTLVHDYDLAVRFGAGDGTFGPETEFAVCGYSPRDLAVNTIDHDASPAIIVSDALGYFSILRQNRP